MVKASELGGQLRCADTSTAFGEAAVCQRRPFLTWMASCMIIVTMFSLSLMVPILLVGIVTDWDVLKLAMIILSLLGVSC